jgi:hypothetical protein
MTSYTPVRDKHVCNALRIHLEVYLLPPT